MRLKRIGFEFQKPKYLWPEKIISKTVVTNLKCPHSKVNNNLNIYYYENRNRKLLHLG